MSTQTVTNTIKILSEVSGFSIEEISKVAEHYPLAVSPFMLKRLQEGSYSIKALRQFLPDSRELMDVDGFVGDPTGENELQPEKAILRTYHNRLAIMVTLKCLVYCRFCFRKEKVGFPDSVMPEAELDKAIDYIAAHPEINDILLSGGDPLSLSNQKLLRLLKKLGDLKQLKAIRIDSRALSVAPDRLDDELLEFLEADGRYWYYAHMNHPDDVNHPEIIAATKRLLSAGIPIYNQCVFLAGVNDDVETMLKLMEVCYEHKIIPYNLYVLDRVKGGGHFDVPIDRIVEIYKAISHLAGPAQPLLVFVDEKSRKHRAVYHESLNLHEFLNMRLNYSNHHR